MGQAILSDLIKCQEGKLFRCVNFEVADPQLLDYLLLTKERLRRKY